MPAVYLMWYCGQPLSFSSTPISVLLPKFYRRPGVLVRPQDPQALAEGILKVLNHPEDYTQPTNLIKSAFSAEDTVSGYENIFRRSQKA